MKTIETKIARETVDVYLGRTSSNDNPIRRYTGLYYQGIYGNENDRIRGSNPAEFMTSLKERENLQNKKINLLKWHKKINPRLLSFFEISDEEFKDFKKPTDEYNTSF